MKLLIDPELCKKNNLTIEEVIYLATIKMDIKVDSRWMRPLEGKSLAGCTGYLSSGIPVGAYLTKDGEEIINQFIADDSTTITTKANRYEILADKLRELFPAGRKAGTNYMWRDSTSIIAKKLKTVVDKYKVEFTDEQAINATKRYISSFNGDFRFMQLLKYFISKKDSITGEENSQLLSYIQNESDETESSNDWTVELK